MQDTRGWVKRIGASVQRGSSALENQHLVKLRPIFALLERLPGLGGPARLVHALHDAAFRTTYSAVRVVTGAITTAADMVLSRRDDVAPRRGFSALN